MSRVVAIFILFLVFAALDGQCQGPVKGPGVGAGKSPGAGNLPGVGGAGKSPGLGAGKGRSGDQRGGKGGAGSGGRGRGAAVLEVGFYNGKCNSFDVESIVSDVVRAQFANDSTITAALLRMQFHDCFVKGCDASILLDGKNSEKTAFPNQNIRGYEIIDAAKAALEALCPGVVSCADIIAMATRDAVALSLGGRYHVQTGRKDGPVSLAKNVNLPAPSISVADSIKVFARKGLDATDMVLLLGGHTVGVAHCSLFQDRVYNFSNTGKPDPTMDSALLKSLRARCRQNSNVDNTVNLNQNPLSSDIVDNSYYKQIVLKRGVLQIDQELALDPLSKATVEDIAGRFDFIGRFGAAMIKLGGVQVLTGKQGQIRRSCRVINKRAN